MLMRFAVNCLFYRNEYHGAETTNDLITTAPYFKEAKLYPTDGEI